MGVCRQHHFDPAFILSLIQVESSFRIKARSSVGAIGLMQLMPATALNVARDRRIRFAGERALTDPYLNLTLGVWPTWHFFATVTKMQVDRARLIICWRPITLDRLRWTSSYREKVLNLLVPRNILKQFGGEFRVFGTTPSLERSAGSG